MVLLKGPSHIQNGARPTSLRAKKCIFARMTAGVCSITAGSAATDLLITDRNSEGARPYISTGLCTTPVSLLTGAGRFLITSFRRAPPEPRPKCDRVHFKQKICSTPWRIWNSATFGRSTISAGDRWICDVGIMPSGIWIFSLLLFHDLLEDCWIF